MDVRFKPGDEVNNYFCVLNANEEIASNGKLYLNLRVSNKYIECNCKLWNYELYKSINGEIVANNIVNIKGTTKLFNNRLVIEIKDISKAHNNEINIEDMCKVSDRPKSELVSDLLHYVSLVKNPVLKYLNSKLLEDPEFTEKFYKKPAASNNHHNSVHGLLEHTVSGIGMAVKWQSLFPFLNLDLLITGYLWHDIGKTIEIESLILKKYSIEGSLLGHPTIGLKMLEKILNNSEL